MFKCLNKQPHKSKNGFTLVELLVTLFLLSIVSTMVAQVTYGVYNNYQLVQKRWRMQNEVNAIMKMFEGNKEALTTSHQADIFYDLNCNSVPAEGDIDETYSYFFAKPIDPDDLTLGYNLWYRQRNTTENYQLNSANIPVNIEFTIPTEPNPLMTNAIGEVKREDNEQGYATVAVPEEEKSYQKSTLVITISATGHYKDRYSLSTSFTLNNMLGNQQINYSFGEPTDTTKNADGEAWAEVYLAGYINAKINDAPENKASGYPVPFTTGENGYNEAQPGNVLRFVSIESFLTSYNPTGNNVDMMNKCFVSKLFMGTSLETPVKGAFRDFRDNVLAKTDIGCTIINKYYNDWSPALNNALSEHPDIVKTFGRAAAIPAAIVAFFTASK